MSLSPQVRRERRAYARKLAEPKKLPRRRCLNCNGWFEKTRKNKKFCRKECKDEYNRYGSAFGPLKEWLAKYIEKASKENFDRKLREFVTMPEGRGVLAEAGFVHRSELAPYATDAQLQLVVHASQQFNERLTTLESKRRPARKWKDTPEAKRKVRR